MRNESAKQKKCVRYFTKGPSVATPLSVAEPMQQFGGNWTEVKLAMLKDYLAAYTTALKNQPFSKMYIDAFAGAGYREIETQADSLGLFAAQAEAEGEGFFDGSAMLALQIPTLFDRYVFIEKKKKYMEELRRAVSANCPSLSGRMDFQPGDANEILPDLCRKTDWKKTRAVLFLDPFGMIGVNRLLKQNPDHIPARWQEKLDRIFGNGEWKKAFFKTSSEQTLFGEEIVTKKVRGSISAIADYYRERLETIFPRVASNPRYLFNTKRSPMFIFTFAVGNPSPKAQGLAMKIARHILGKVR